MSETSPRIVETLVDTIANHLHTQSERINTTNLLITEMKRTIERDTELLRDIERETDSSDNITDTKNQMLKQFADTMDQLSSMQKECSELNIHVGNLLSIAQKLEKDSIENTKRIQYIYAFCKKLKNPTTIITAIATGIATIASAIIAIIKNIV